MQKQSAVVNSVPSSELAVDILHLILENRRMLEGQEALEPNYEEEMAPHIGNVQYAIDNGLPVHMVLPGFPAKSPSRKKTLSHMPDFGEELAFNKLNTLCKKIEAIYPHGAKVTVCSDGRVFADVVHIPDQHVTDYNAELRRKYRDRFDGNIDFFDLDDVYPGMTNYDFLREELMMAYGEALDSLRERCKTEPEAGAMYKGITRFLFEDYSGIALFEGQSKTAIQKQARESAYRVIQRSNAWGRLVAKHLPRAIRLSIHPQLRVSHKIGVNLVGDDRWTTPWHSVVLSTPDGYTLMPRHKVEELNVALVFQNGKPSYYQMMS